MEGVRAAMGVGPRLGFWLAGAVTMAASPVGAVDREHFRLRLGGEYAEMISGSQREQGDFRHGFHLRAAFGWQAAPLLEVQLGYGYWNFPRPGQDRRAGAMLSPFAAMRVNLVETHALAVAVQVAAGPQWTGGDLRFGGDAGLAVEYSVTSWFEVGVATRIGATFANSEESTAVYWSGGLSLALRAPPLDHDRDNVPDAEDVCPMESCGEIPDPARRGCALDSDGDGVADQGDGCKLVPEGQPNPVAPGCPAVGAASVLSGQPTAISVPIAVLSGPVTVSDGSFHPTVTEPSATPPDATPPSREPDRDDDGYGDSHDACVELRETFNGVDDQDGCPDGPAYVRFQYQLVRFDVVPGFTGDRLNTRDQDTLRALRALGAMLQARCTQSATVSVRADVGEAGAATAQARGDNVVAWLRAHRATGSADRCTAPIRWRSAVSNDATNPMLIEVRLP